MIQRKFKCIECGKERPCIITIVHNEHNLYDDLVHELTCVLDADDKKGCTWKELKPKKLKDNAEKNN